MFKFGKGFDAARSGIVHAERFQMKRLIKNLSVILSVLLISITALFNGGAAAKAESLNFSKTGTAKIAVGKSFTRAAVVTPNGLTVAYASNDTSVATVDANGKVSGKKPGKIVITASAGGLKASYNVTVVPAVRFLEGSDLTLTVGQTNVRKATALPKGKVKYKSSDISVATVSTSGNVTAKSLGTAIITASSGGGSASYKVTVTAYVPASSNNWDYYGDDNDSTYQSGGKAKSQYAAQVIRIVNQNRAKMGLDELVTDDGLMESAQIRAEELVELYSHVRPDGSEGWEMAWDSVSMDDGETHAVGENIAYGQKSADAVMTAWMNSTGHHKNIMNETYTMIGVGCYEKNGTLYWAQLFAG